MTWLFLLRNLRPAGLPILILAVLRLGFSDCAGDRSAITLSRQRERGNYLQLGYYPCVFLDPAYVVVDLLF